MKQNWTKEHLEFLIKNFPANGTKYCSKFLPFTNREISIKADQMKIKRIKICRNDPHGYKTCEKCYKTLAYNFYKKAKYGIYGLCNICKPCFNKHEQNRKRTDLNYSILSRLRRRQGKFLRRLKLIRKSSSLKYLGCSKERFMEYFQSKFREKMSWEEYFKGNIHLDHIRPLISFDLTKEKDRKEAFHYTNLQPLWAKENLAKSDKYYNQ